MLRYIICVYTNYLQINCSNNIKYSFVDSNFTTRRGTILYCFLFFYFFKNNISCILTLNRHSTRHVVFKTQIYFPIFFTNLVSIQ